MKGPKYLRLNMRRVMISLIEKQRAIGETIDANAIADRSWTKIALAAKRIWHVPDAIVAPNGWVADWFLLGEYTDSRRAVFARLDRETPKPKPPAARVKKGARKQKKRADARRKQRAAEAQFLRDRGLI